MEYMSGDVELSPIKMTSLTGNRAADISGQVIEINIYEDITSPLITGQLIIEDGIDLLTQFPIVGEEQITFTMTTPQQTQQKITLNVAHAVNGYIETNIKSRTYVLDLISPEYYNSRKTAITHKYKDSISNIIKSVISDNLESSKTYATEGTMGVEDIVIDRLEALPAIDYLRRRSVSSKYKSGSYCFFENKDGFHLATLEGIFAKNKGNVGNRKFHYNNNANYDTTAVTLRDIIAHEHVRLVDTPTGLGGVKVTTLDIVSGDVKVTDYPDSTSQVIDPKGQGTNSSSFTSKFKTSTAKTSTIAIDNTVSQPPIDEKVGHIKPLISRITANLLNVHVYGDTSITAGDVIEVQLPQVQGGTAPTQTDRLYAGNYLVAKLRHMIEVSPRPYHTMSFELIKGSFLEGA